MTTGFLSANRWIATPASKRKRVFQNKGFSLIEVLVTLVIFSIGLLGMAALQTRALKNTYASFQRSLATLQAQDLVDRLWTSTCILSDSTKRDLVISEWQTVHQASSSTKLSMPNWSGTVNYTAASGLFTISIGWTDFVVNSGQASLGASQSLVQYTQIPTVTCN